MDTILSLMAMISTLAAEAAEGGKGITGNIHIAAAAIGAGLGIGLLGAKAAEATGRNPGAAGNIMTISIILAALAEGLIFIAIFLGGK